MTGDPGTGVVWPGDVLIEDDRIAAIGPAIGRRRRMSSMSPGGS